jgi:hypothetical protein
MARCGSATRSLARLGWGVPGRRVPPPHAAVRTTGCARWGLRGLLRKVAVRARAGEHVPRSLLGQPRWKRDTKRCYYGRSAAGNTTCTLSTMLVKKEGGITEGVRILPSP